jgi:hypothetical protein
MPRDRAPVATNVGGVPPRAAPSQLPVPSEAALRRAGRWLDELLTRGEWFFCAEGGRPVPIPPPRAAGRRPKSS